jgi:hypothetical protein
MNRYYHTFPTYGKSIFRRVIVMEYLLFHVRYLRNYKHTYITFASLLTLFVRFLR